MNKLRNKWGPLAAYLLLAVAVAFSMVKIINESDTRDREILTKAVAVCEQSNKFRREVNIQAESFQHHNAATLTFFQRFKKLQTSKDAIAEINKVIVVYNDVQQRYEPVDILDCQEAFKAG